MCAKITTSAIAVMLAAIACSEPMSPPARPRVQAGLAPPARGYTITDLGTLGGGFAEARAINDVGQVVGLSETAAGEQHAFVWTAAGGMKDLGTLGGTFSRAFAINHLGHVAGVSELPSGERRPFLWTPAGGMQDLGTFGGGFGRARGINDLDQVVGRSDLPDGSFHAFLWTAAQGMTDLAPVRRQQLGGARCQQPTPGGGWRSLRHRRQSLCLHDRVSLELARGVPQPWFPWFH